MKLRLWPSWCLVSALLFMMACSDDNQVDNVPRQDIPPSDYTFVHFNPASGNPAEITLPNDILRNPATGQNSIPQTGDPAVDSLVNQINTLSGFSTAGPIVIPFAGRIDAATVSNQSIRVVDLVDLQLSQKGQQVNPFPSYSFQVSERDGSSVVVGFPVTPLKPGRPHMVIVTQGVIGQPSGEPVESEAVTIFLKRQTPLVNASGTSQVSALSDAQAQALEPLRTAFQGIWTAAEGVTQQGRQLIPFAWAFTTQTLYSTVAELRGKARTPVAAPQIEVAVEGTEAVDGFFNLLGLGAVPHNAIGAFYRGSISMPNYISNPLTGSFVVGADGQLVQQGTLDIPFIAAFPSAQGPVPAVIYQHGITRSKDDMLAVANGLCANGAGVIAIDLALHGDRTFGIDVLNNTTGAPGADGVPDASGAHFINLANLLVSRDNVRQSVADLMRLTHAITSGALDLNGDGASEFAPLVGFVGQSLGGIVGGTFVAAEPTVNNAVLNVAGGRIPYLLRGSQSFSPRINAGLAQAGIVEGSFLYELFFLVAQTIVDDADPFNYATTMFSGSISGGVGTNVLIQEVIDDSVVPNSATEDLARAMGIQQIDALSAIDGLAQVASPQQGSGLFQFDNAAHGSLIDPSAGPTAAIQLQAFTFIFSGFQGQPSVVNPLTAAGKQDVSFGMDVDIDPKSMSFFPKAQ